MKSITFRIEDEEYEKLEQIAEASEFRPSPTRVAQTVVEKFIRDQVIEKPAKKPKNQPQPA